MSAIEASSVGVRTLVDGTLRLSIDVEPRHAQAAFALFGAPGTPMALAALRIGKADSVVTSPEPVQKPAESEHVGKLTRDAGIICKNPQFQQYALSAGHHPAGEQGAANFVRAYCRIASRRELDTDPKAAARFARLMAGYREWAKNNRIETERETA